MGSDLPSVVPGIPNHGATVAIRHVLGLLERLGATIQRALKNAISIFHVDVEERWHRSAVDRRADHDDRVADPKLRWPLRTKAAHGTKDVRMNATRASGSSTAIRGITAGQPTGMCFEFTICDSWPPKLALTCERPLILAPGARQVQLRVRWLATDLDDAVDGQPDTATRPPSPCVFGSAGPNGWDSSLPLPNRSGALDRAGREWRRGPDRTC